MKFNYKDFSCDVDIFYEENDIMARFYDSSKEQNEADIINLVIVNPGYGYVFLKIKGNSSGILGGYLDEEVFTNDEMVQAAIGFVEALSPLANNIYIPHHIDRFKVTSYVEYNGEY